MEGIEISDSNRWKKDEEEVLKWEDNEHDVPTYNNNDNVIRRGSDDERIISLSMEEKRNLLNRLMNIPQAEEDNHNFLLKLKQRFHRYVIFLTHLIVEMVYEHCLNIFLTTFDIH